MNNIKIFATSPNNNVVVAECEKICNENHINNGGVLRHTKLYEESDYVIYCEINNQIVGYMYLSKGFIFKNDIYIEQISVKKSMQKSNIGTAMVNYVKKHFKQFTYITSNVLPSNEISLNFHKKIGFKHVGYNEYGLTFVYKNQEN